LLADAGLAGAVLAPLADAILLGGGGSLAEAVKSLREGSMGRAVLAGADEAAQDQVVAAVSDALAPYVTAEGVRIGTGAWLVTARRP